MRTTPLTRSVQIYKALAHPARLRILLMLRGGPLCGCQMSPILGLAASTISLGGIRMASDKKRVLFICTHNSARSQMAEGLLRHYGGDAFEARSAGTERTHVRPLAVRAMQEMGIDISGQSSKTLDQFVEQHWDYVITVCDQANESCPLFPGGATRLHWSLEDPSGASGPEEDRLSVFRRVRDEILGRIRTELLRS